MTDFERIVGAFDQAGVPYRVMDDEHFRALCGPGGIDEGRGPWEFVADWVEDSLALSDDLAYLIDRRPGHRVVLLGGGALWFFGPGGSYLGAEWSPTVTGPRERGTA